MTGRMWETTMQSGLCPGGVPGGTLEGRSAGGGQTQPRYAPLFAYALWRQHVAGGARSSWVE